MAVGAVCAAQTPAYRIERGPARSNLGERFTTGQVEVLELLNRADAKHLPRLEALVVPGSWPEDPQAVSPLPREYPWGARLPKLVVVEQRIQSFGAYEAGRLVRTGPVSTGRRSRPTPAGLFHLNWRSPGRHSTVDPEWFMKWYFNFDNRRGLSFHEFDLPGLPASHACVRLLERDARWLYDWGEEWTLDERRWNAVTQGTPVLVLGCYDFASPPPWRSVERLGRPVALPVDPPLAYSDCRSQKPAR